MILDQFATKTELMEKKSTGAPKTWPVGIDFGFSGVKVYTRNKVLSFPNCAVKIPDDTAMFSLQETDIVLKDETGTWLVGESATKTLTSANVMNYETEMYSRQRYFTPMFKTLVKAGLAMAISGNRTAKYKGEPIYVQTGLPPKFKYEDTPLIKNAITGLYKFELKVGKGEFQTFAFEITEDAVQVIDQPMGSLMACITDASGSQDEAGLEMLNSNTVIFDVGFKTLDLFSISAGKFKDSHTFDNLGMHEVFRRTAEKLKERYGANVSVAEMQNHLRNGYVVVMDRVNLKSEKVAFEQELKESSSEVCRDAFQKLLSVYDYLQNVNYLVITGGTGSAWEKELIELTRNIESVKVVFANCNDTSLSNTYSNARGYFYYLLGQIEAQEG